MAEDRHPGRSTFVIEGNPDSFIRVIDTHGIHARIMQARRCPCASSKDTSGRRRRKRLCKVCGGDTYMYEFQRKLLQANEDSPNMNDKHILEPWRFPILDVLAVEVIPEAGTFYAGGNEPREVVEFGNDYIRIDKPVEKHQCKLVSYFFDRFNRVQGELLDVDPASLIMTASGARERSVNWLNIYGDIAIIERLYHRGQDYTYDQSEFMFTKNQVYVVGSGPAPTPGEMEMDYYYAPPAKAVPGDVRIEQPRQEGWSTALQSGGTPISLHPWYRVGDGDLITLLTVEIDKEDTIIAKGSGAPETLPEFDVGRIQSDILAINSTGNLVKYQSGVDFTLFRFNQIKWLKNGPPPGQALQVRYTYRPTFRVFIDNPEQNNLENKQYPMVVNTKLFQGSMDSNERLQSSQPPTPSNKVDSSYQTQIS